MRHRGLMNGHAAFLPPGVDARHVLREALAPRLRQIHPSHGGIASLKEIRRSVVVEPRDGRDIA